jgi:hypothetical protein
MEWKKASRKWMKMIDYEINMQINCLLLANIPKFVIYQANEKLNLFSSPGVYAWGKYAKPPTIFPFSPPKEAKMEKWADSGAAFIPRRKRLG